MKDKSLFKCDRELVVEAGTSMGKRLPVKHSAKLLVFFLEIDVRKALGVDFFGQPKSAEGRIGREKPVGDPGLSVVSRGFINAAFFYRS